MSCLKLFVEPLKNGFLATPMANNRFYLGCRQCVLDEESEEGLIFLGKYFPNSGWYRHTTGEKFENGLNEWMERHSHTENMSLFGYDPTGSPPFFLHFEAGNRSQDQILKEIQAAIWLKT